MKFAALALLLSVGCAHVDRAALGAAVVTTLADWRSTRNVAETGWANHYENNPIMGQTPSVRTVDAYMIGVLVLTVAAYPVLPSWARKIVYPAIAIIETRAVIGNREVTGQW